MKRKDVTKEEKIKEVTLRLVASDGIAGVKMSRIAKVAQLSPSMIYTYFKNKEDLLLNVFRDCLKILVQSLVSQRVENVPYKAKIFHDFNIIIQLKLNKSKEYTFFRSFIQSPYFQEDHNQLMMDDGGNHLIKLFVEGQEAMIVKDQVDIFLLMAMFDGFSDKLVELHQNKRIDLNQKSIEDAFTLLWDAIRQ